jgi:Ca-activated chloride channel family protein
LTSLRRIRRFGERTMDRKTTTILCAAGGLIAAAVALQSRNDQASAAPSQPIARPEPIKVLNQDTCSVGDALPAKATADFGSGTMNAALSGSRVLLAGNGEVYMAVDLVVKERPGEKRAPVNMAIVIDHSGSMAGDKIVQARSAAKGIVERLDAGDRVALIQYDDTAQVLVSSINMDGEGKKRMIQAIDGIGDAGGTNLHGGMMLGIAEAKKAMGGERINRVVLLSDGQANVGVVDPQLIARDASQAADQGVRVTTIGLGIDYNEDLMEAIAENGRGQYYYVKDAAGLESVFAGELRSMQGTVATAAELRIDPACAGVEVADVYGYNFRRDGRSVVVPLSDMFGGEKRKVLVKLKVPAGTSGAKGLARTTLAFEDKIAGGKKTASVNLGVEVSGDADAVRQSIDSEVMGKVEEVEAARTMRAAAEAYDRGDQAGARKMLGEQRERTKKRAQEYNLPAASTGAVMAPLEEMDKDFEAYAPGSMEGKAATKGAKAGARDLSK